MNKTCSDEYKVTSNDDVTLQLRRYRAEKKGSKAVLLVHGASASHDTFLTPNGGLAKYLADNGLDVWLLDWRASHRVVIDDANKGLLKSESRSFNFNAAAARDLEAGFKQMKECGVKFPVAVAGHCMGGGIIAEAVACGHHEGKIDKAVLLTLGLFYDVTLDGKLKTLERVLERHSDALSIDPRVDTTMKLHSPWPEELEQMYQDWPEDRRGHAKDSGPIEETCNRLSFIYGMPYHHANLVEDIHDKAKPGCLPALFGAIPLQMLIHGTNNIRQGRATLFDPSVKVDAFLTSGESTEARRRFRDLEKVTMITGALNRLWHHNSIDLMHEWLYRGKPPRAGTIVKHVLADYGHQDLLWGRESRVDVFPKILSGLCEDSRKEYGRASTEERRQCQNIDLR